MSNPVRGEVELELGGRKYPLRISLNVLAETQELLGLDDFNQVMERLNGGRADFIMIRALVAAVLRDHIPGLGVREAGTMIGMNELRPTMDAIALALDRAFSGGTAEDAAEGSPPAAAA